MWEIITGETNRKSFKTTIYIFSTISFTYYFILFKHHKSPTSESMLFVVKERIEGLKYNIDLGEGWGYTGGGDRYVHYGNAKRGHFIEVSQHFCPSLYLKS